jgi:hypothetical protein
LFSGECAAREKLAQSARNAKSPRAGSLRPGLPRLPRHPAVWLNPAMGRHFYGFYFFFPRHLAEGNG